jgi:hypothetical protein
MEKQEAKAIYFRIGRVWCPALGDYVVFNREGFRHLIRKQGTLRSPSEQSRRLALIPYVKEILEKSLIVAEHRTEQRIGILRTHGNKKIGTTQIDFWSLKVEQNGEIITVVIRQSPGGIKHFLSVF